MSDAAKTESHAPAPKARSRLVPIVLGVVCLLLAGGGAGGYWLYQQRSGTAHAEEAPPPPPGVVTLEPFVVNLADPGNRRFLRLELNLLTWDEHQAEELEENAVGHARMRSSILELLSLQYAEPLMTPEGKAELKHAIAERAEAAVDHLEITDVLFVEFVVQ